MGINYNPDDEAEDAKAFIWRRWRRYYYCKYHGKKYHSNNWAAYRRGPAHKEILFQFFSSPFFFCLYVGQNYYIFEKSQKYLTVILDNSHTIFWDHDTIVTSRFVVFFEIICWRHRSRFILSLYVTDHACWIKGEKAQRQKKNTQNTFIHLSVFKFVLGNEQKECKSRNNKITENLVLLLNVIIVKFILAWKL